MIRNILILLLCMFAALISDAYGATLQSISEQIADEASKNARVQWELNISSDRSSEVQHVTSLGSVLQVKSFWNDSANTNHITIERYTTNEFTRYQRGNAFKGTPLEDEVHLEPEAPVLGIPLFASPFFQNRILKLLANTKLAESDYQGEPTYVVSGQTTLEGTVPSKITLTFSQKDFLLLEEDVNLGSNWVSAFDIKTTRIRNDTTATNTWPYATFYNDYRNNKTVGRAQCVVTAKCTIKEASETIPELKIPDGVLITDQRSLKNYKSYLTGPTVKQSGKSDLNLNHFAARRFIVMGVLFVLTTVPISIWYFGSRKKV